MTLSVAGLSALFELHINLRKNLHYETNTIKKHSYAIIVMPGLFSDSAYAWVLCPSAHRAGG